MRMLKRRSLAQKAGRNHRAAKRERQLVRFFDFAFGIAALVGVIGAVVGADWGLGTMFFFVAALIFNQKLKGWVREV